MARRHKSAEAAAIKKIMAEGRKQSYLHYSATALALSRNWNMKQAAIIKIFEAAREVMKECEGDIDKSMIQMCEAETGIEIQNGDGRSWRDLAYLNSSLDMGPLTQTKVLYMRQQQVKWVAPQIMACLLIAMHRKKGFGFERCQRLYQQVQEIIGDYDQNVDKIRKACLEETKVNITDILEREQE